MLNLLSSPPPNLLSRYQLGGAAGAAVLLMITLDTVRLSREGSRAEEAARLCSGFSDVT